MNWRDHIHSDPGIFGGKPIFRNTRYLVERALKLVGAGWDYARIADEYPGILPEHLRAAALFAAELMHDESYVAIGQARAA
jgi:uncharacterized protein (DUF433 family)